MSRLVLAVVLLCTLSASSWANLPDPTLSTIPPVVMVPDNPNLPGPPTPVPPITTRLNYKVTLIGPLGPVKNALVEIKISPAANSLISWCDGVDHAPRTTRVLDGFGNTMVTATSNNSGEATFTLSGSGCIKLGQVSPFVVKVYANGVLLAEVPILSPDVVNTGGQTTQQSGTRNGFPSNVTAVSLSDATFMTGPFASGTYNLCADFDGNGTVTTGDATIATEFIVDGNICSCVP